MLWIVLKRESHQIIACNIAKKGNEFELWVTRPNDKGLCIAKSEKLEDVQVIKEAIDFAIEQGEKALRIA